MGVKGGAGWVGPLVQTVGTLMAASSKRSTGQSAQYISEINALEKEKEAKLAIKRSRFEQGRFRKDSKRFIGEQRARLAAQGVDVGEGSALDVLADMAGDAEIDALLIGYEGDLESDAAMHDASVMRYQGGVAAREGRDRSTATLIQGAGSLLEDYSKFDYRSKKTTGYSGVGTYGMSPKQAQSWR